MDLLKVLALGEQKKAVKTARGRWLRMGEHGVEISRALFVPKWLQRRCTIQTEKGQYPSRTEERVLEHVLCLINTPRPPDAPQKHLSGLNCSIACVVLKGEKKS